jgi:ureidoglycolate lyase
MLKLTAQPLTAQAFAPFGDVIDSRSATNSFPINGGRTQRHHNLADIEVLGEGGRPIISIFVSQPVQVPLEVDCLERHPLGSQAFIPMHGERFLIVVAPPGDGIDPETICAFVTDGHQGINYRAGIWHAVHSVLGCGGEFIVVDRGGPGHNCDEKPVEALITLS